eukprot:1156243-Pelagomonas_calceolata.AAC.4
MSARASLNVQQQTSGNYNLGLAGAANFRQLQDGVGRSPHAAAAAAATAAAEGNLGTCFMKCAAANFRQLQDGVGRSPHAAAAAAAEGNLSMRSKIGAAAALRQQRRRWGQDEPLQSSSREMAHVMPFSIKECSR